MTRVAENFTDAQVEMDGDQFIECTFKCCVLIYRGAGAVWLDSCDFVDCRWHFTGPAGNTIGLLVALAKDGHGPTMQRSFPALVAALTAEPKP